MNKERVEYFISQLEAMATLKQQRKDVGALARGKTEEILWESVDDKIDADLAEKSQKLDK